MLMMMVHPWRRGTVRLGLLVPLAGLLSASRGAQVLRLSLHAGDSRAGGTVVPKGLRTKRKRKPTLQTLARTVGLLVVLMEEMV